MLQSECQRMDGDGTVDPNFDGGKPFFFDDMPHTALDQEEWKIWDTVNSQNMKYIIM